MKLSTTIVEQVNSDNNVVLDYAEILSNKEIIDLALSVFPGTFVRNGQIFGRYDKTDFCLYIKNISYLGNPHPLYKKRIQIPANFKDLYDDNININVKTLLLGIYKYRDCILFCDFDTSSYVKNNLNNSSAHLFTIDLKTGNETGFFQKNDFRGNKITVFNSFAVEDYYKSKFEHTEIECKLEIARTFDDFFKSISKEWFGIKCYEDMFRNNSVNKNQGEWAGFYLEYLLQHYIETHHLYDIVRFLHNKKDNQIDLDLYFSKINSYGDLKMHTESASGVLGNDKETIEKLIENGKVYYIVCNHETVMDKDHDGVVTKFWNSHLGKTDLTSYLEKMKYSIKIKGFYILEINKFNCNYLDVYHQGKNSDGKPRKPKISINSKYIDNFLIHSVEFKD